MDALLEQIALLPLFREARPEDLARLWARSRRVLHGAGEIVYRRGALGDTLHVIESGRVRVEHPRGVEQVLGPGGVFGALGFLRVTEREESVTAIVETRVVSVSARDLQDIVAEDPAAGRRLLDAVCRGLCAVLRGREEDARHGDPARIGCERGWSGSFENSRSSRTWTRTT